MNTTSTPSFADRESALAARKAAAKLAGQTEVVRLQDALAAARNRITEDATKLEAEHAANELRIGAAACASIHPELKRLLSTYFDSGRGRADMSALVEGVRAILPELQRLFGDASNLGHNRIAARLALAAAEVVGADKFESMRPRLLDQLITPPAGYGFWLVAYRGADVLVGDVLHDERVRAFDALEASIKGLASAPLPAKEGDVHRWQLLLEGAHGIASDRVIAYDRECIALAEAERRKDPNRGALRPDMAGKFSADGNEERIDFEPRPGGGGLLATIYRKVMS